VVLALAVPSFRRHHAEAAGDPPPGAVLQGTAATTEPG
jgi:hypothetical protein